jgi:hypothetical protein
VEPPKGRNVERERVRGERDRDAHNLRREVKIRADQRPQDDTKSKRNADDHDCILEDPAARKFLALQYNVN